MRRYCVARWRRSSGDWPTRSLIAFRRGSSAFFIYGYPKNERANITNRELEALRLLAKELLGYNREQIMAAVKAGELFEVHDDGET